MREWDLNVHKISHSAVKRYKCGFCEKRYKHEFAVKNHVRMEHLNDNNDKYECKICDIEFKTIATLRSHRKLCNIELKISCPFCEKKLRNKYKMKKHIDDIHNNQAKYNFECDVCGKKF